MERRPADADAIRGSSSLSVLLSLRNGLGLPAQMDAYRATVGKEQCQRAIHIVYAKIVSACHRDGGDERVGSVGVLEL